MSSFEEVAKRVSEKKQVRIQAARDRYVQERAVRLAKIAVLMEEADARGETSIMVGFDLVQTQEDLEYIRLHVTVKNSYNPHGQLSGYEINW